jgi:hypothetical protein
MSTGICSGASPATEAAISDARAIINSGAKPVIRILYVLELALTTNVRPLKIQIEPH